MKKYFRLLEKALGILFIVAGVLLLPPFQPYVAMAADTFLGLTDTPASYSGYASRAVAVNGSATGLVFSSNVYVTDDYVKAKYFVAEYTAGTTALAYRFKHTGAPASGDKVIYDLGIYSDDENLFLRGYDGAYQYFVDIDWDSGVVEFPAGDVLVSGGSLEAVGIVVDDATPTISYEVDGNERFSIGVGTTNDDDVYLEFRGYNGSAMVPVGLLVAGGQAAGFPYFPRGAGATDFGRKNDSCISDCIAGGDYSTVSGGINNTASGDYSAIPGGRQNQAIADYSTAMGYYGNARHYAGLSIGSGVPYGQHTFLLAWLDNTALTDSWHKLSLDYEGNEYLTVADDAMVLIDAQVLIASCEGYEVGAYKLTAVVTQQSGNPSVLTETLTTLFETEPSWDVSVRITSTDGPGEVTIGIIDKNDEEILVDATASMRVNEISEDLDG